MSDDVVGYPPEVMRARLALLSEGEALLVRRSYPDALACFEQLLAHDDPGGGLQGDRLVARALRRRAATLRMLGRTDEVAAVSDELVARFGDEADAEVREQVSFGLSQQVQVMLRADRPAEALSAAERLIDRVDGWQPEWARGLAARGMSWKAAALFRLGRSADALTARRELVARFADETAPGLRSVVADALYRQVFSLRELGREEEAIGVLDEVVRRFGADPPNGRTRFLVDARLQKARSLRTLGRLDEAVVIYDELASESLRDDSDGAPELAAETLRLKATSLWNARERLAATEVADEVPPGFADSLPAVAMSDWVTVLLVKAIGLHEFGAGSQALAAVDVVLDRYDVDPAPELLAPIANALGIKARILADEFGRAADARLLTREIVDRFAQATDPELLVYVAIALYNEGTRERKAGNPPGALACYQELLDRFDHDPSGDIAPIVLMAAVGRAHALRNLGRAGEAADAAQDVIERFGHRDTPEIDRHVATAMYERAAALELQGQARDAMSTLDVLISRYEQTSDAETQQVVRAGHRARSLDDRYARARRRERRTALGLAGLIGGASLISSAAITRPSPAIRRAGATSADVSLLLIAAVTRNGMHRVTSLTKRRPLTTAVATEVGQVSLAVVAAATTIAARVRWHQRRQDAEIVLDNT